MKNGTDSKRVEESAFAKLGRSIASVFKSAKKEVERPEPAGPSINPEALTAQKREWIDSQAAQGQQTLATWPEHLFEHFFVVGLPPDIEITRIAEDLWAQEVRQRQDGGEQHGGAAGAAAAAAVAGVVDGAGGGGSSVAGGSGRGGSKSQQQYDKAPRPAYDAQVLFRHPANKIAPLSDQELVDMCFPHKVTPVKLRRSPSLSSLHEVVYGRNAAARDDQCFIFLLKVGTNLPLYGICCAVPEVLHRPPHLARHMFPACRMPFRSVMIAAPRVYCLLSHYPFFDLHFQVLNVILGMERLHRTIDFNAELDGSGAAAAAAAQSSTAAGGGGGGVAGTPVAAAGGGDATAKVPHQPPPQQPPPQQHTQQPPQQPQTPQQQQRQPPRGAVRLSSRCYCQDCANAIVDMYPGLLQPWELDPLRPSRPGRPSLTGRLLSADDPWVTPVAAAAVAGRGAPLEAVPGGAALAAIRTQGSVRRLSDPGSAGFLSPRLDSGTLPVAPSELVAAGEQRQSRRLLGASGACSVLAVPSPAGPWVSNTASALASMHGLAAMESCQACGRMLGCTAPASAPPPPPPPPPPPKEEEGNAPEQGLLEEAAGALESALDKLAGLPRAVATSMNEAAAAAAVVLRRVSPGPGTAAAAAAASGGGTRPKAGTPSGGAAGRGGGGGSGDGSGDGAGQLPCLDSDSYLSSDMGTPHAAANSSAMAARALVATPAEAVSAFATIVRDSLKAIGSSAISTGRRRRSVGDGVCGASDGGASAAAAAAEQPDGLHIRRVGPDQSAAAFINVHLSSPLKSSRKLIQHLAAAVSGGGTAAPAAAAPPQLPPPLATKPTALLAWNSSAVTVAGGPVDGTAAAGAGGLASDASVSLVQQLMRSVMVPVSPVQGALAGSEACSPTGRAPGLFSGVQSCIQSPEKPGSPQQEPAVPHQHHHQHQHQQQQHQQLVLGSRNSSDVAAAAAAATAAGYNYSWSLLQRLSRRSQSRSAAGEVPPGGLKEDPRGGGGGGGELQDLGAGGGSTVARPLDRSSSYSSKGDRHYDGLPSAFVTAVDLAAAAAAVEQQQQQQRLASPRTPLGHDATAEANATAAVAAAAAAAAMLSAARASDDCHLVAAPPLPPTAMLQVALSPDGHTIDAGSQYASLPHSGPASRSTTEQGPGVWSCVGASEGDGAPSPAAAAVLAAAPHLLLAEHSGFSVNPSDASFYSADGVEEECTPRGEHGAAATAAAAGPAERQALQPSFTTYTPSVLQPPGGLASGSSPPVGGWRFSVDLPPMSYSGGGAVVTRPRSAAFVPLLPGSRSSPAGAASGGGGGSGGGAAYGGSVLPLPSGLATAAAAALPGPSRLARTSAPLTQEGAGPRSNAAAAASAAAPVTGTATAAISPQLSASTSAMALLPRARSGGGAAAAGCCQPGGTPAPGQSSHGTSSGGGVVSPPPAGVSVTSSDMSHHFSPRHALDQLYGYPPVHPGEQMTLRFGGVATLQYTRPVLGRRFTVLGPPRSIQSYAEAELAEGLQHWTSSMLCRSLSLDKLLLVLTAVLLERQVVVFCPHISVLTGCVLGLLPLLRPFCWQSLMLPVTPASMMGFLEAPVPFVLGVQYKTSDVMARCSHLIRVNVYKDQVKNGGPSLPQLPGLKKLSAALAPHHALLRRRVLAHPGGGGGVGGGAAGGGGGGGGGGGAGVAGPALPLGMLLAGNQAAAAAESAAAGGRSLRAMSSAELSAASSFLSILSHHLIGLCGDLRPHVITNVGLSKRTGVLMKESLLEVIPPRDKPFVRQFVETQMFSVWSDALISANFEGSFAAA